MATPLKLDLAKIRKIFKLRREGLSYHQIGIKVGVTGETVRKCIKSIEEIKKV